MSPIEIQFNSGISKSPQTGFDRILNCDIDEDGCFKPNLKYHIVNRDNLSGLVFTADESTDTITHADLTDDTTGLYGNDIRAVTVLSEGGSLPTGLSAGTIYWLVRVSNTQSKLASTWQNANASPEVVINFTTNGSGVLKMTSVNMGTVRQIDGDGTNHFAIDNAGRVWVKNLNTTNWEYVFDKDTDVNGTGCVIFRNYLLAFGDRYIDALGPLNADRKDWSVSASFLDTGASGSSSSKHVILGRGNTGENVWYTNGETIGSLYQNSGQVFNPSSGATYTSTTNAYTPKANPTCLADNGDDLIIGTEKGGEIWDKFSSTSELPFSADKYISAITISNNLVFYLAGESSSETLGLYNTNGTSAEILTQIPRRIATTGYGTKNGIKAIKDKIYFLLNSTSSIYNSDNASAMWSYNISKGNLTLEHLSLDGTYTATNNVIYGSDSQSLHPMFYATGTNIGSIVSPGGYYQIYDNYEPTVITGLITVGTMWNKQTINSVDFIFDRPLVSSDEIRLSYRRSSQGAWTTLANVGNSTISNNYASVRIENGILDVDIIQFKIELNNENDGTTDVSGPTIKTMIIS